MGIYKYKVTFEDLGGRKIGPEPNPPFVFHTENHDNIVDIAHRQRDRWHFTPDEAASLAIGLKLLGEVALAHRKDPLFAPLMPEWRQFIQRIKNGPQAHPADETGITTEVH